LLQKRSHFPSSVSIVTFHTFQQREREVFHWSLPKLAAEVARSFGRQSTVKSERIRYEYQMGGRPWEESVCCTLVYTNWQMGTLRSVHSPYVGDTTEWRRMDRRDSRGQ